MSDPASEVEAVCRSEARRERVSRETAAKRRSIYGTALETLGLALPALRRIHRAGFSFTRAPAAPEEVLAAFESVWRESSLFESKIQPLLYYEAFVTNARKKAELDPRTYFPALAGWVGDARSGCDNWEHSDRFSKIFADFHERAPKLVYPKFQEWNASENPWLRRQSVVGLICYADLRTRFPAKTKVFPLVRRLLDDEDVYVQKGVGWTLREVGRVYPEETLAFLERHVRELRPPAFGAAVEKLGRADKERLKQARR